ncbi:MAG: hypothetical protein LBH19_02945 [Dysgonamonadaceae bacterium]|jgi:hypothetical protein|nr:hypothetical protein [Dysgonamonadaceae bacterium]
MKRYIFLGVAILSLIAAIAVQMERIRVISSERDSYRQNTTVLLGEIGRYKTKDSLSAVSVHQLELKLTEVNRYRSEDMKLIETLKVDKKRLQQITTAQTQTIYELSATVRDSIVYRDRYIIDTLRCVNIRDAWFDLEGCIENNRFMGKFESRDSLLYIEHTVSKRFWFIKWGCKERRQEIVSRNPHTVITGAEFITIRK